VCFAILIVIDEAIAAYRTRNLRAARGTDVEVVQVLAATGFALRVRAYRVVADHRTPLLPGFDPQAEYRSGVARIAGGGDLRLPRLAVAAVHVCEVDWTALVRALEECCAEGVPEDDQA